MRKHIISLTVVSLLLSGQGTCPAPAQANKSMELYQLTTDGANLLRAGDFTGAEDKLNQALKVDPRSWEATYYMAYLYERMGRKPEALAWYQKAVPLDPSRHLALLGVARMYYEEADFKNALPLFEQLAADHPATEHTYDGYMALARCYAETGNIDRACDSFDKALAVRPKDANGWKLAAQELDYLKQYEPAMKYYKEYLRRFPAAADAKQVATRLNQLNYQDERTELLDKVDHNRDFDTDTEDLPGFITYLDGKHTGVSDLAMAQVLLGLKEIPRTYRHQLENAGYKVLVVPTILDAMPQLAGQVPRGFAQGSTWHNANGTFDRIRKLIIVAEKIDIAGGASSQEALLDETVQHEFGHAYDHFIGLKVLGKSSTNPYPEFSQGPAFSRAYDQDVAGFPGDLKGRFAYFLQPGAAGKEELFAQMFPIFFGNTPRPGTYEEFFKIAFPNVLRLMADARKYDPDYERLRNLYDAKLKRNLLLPAERTQELLKEP